MSSSVALVREYGGTHLPAVGTYDIDQSHTSVEFVARHMMISKVRGRFTDFDGAIQIGDAPEDSSVEVTIDAGSLTTGDDKRDGHLRSADFFDLDQYPEITFRSTSVEVGRDGKGRVAGDLTIRGVTRPVALDVEFEGGTADPWGGQRLGFTASTEVDREDWGLVWNVVLETGSVLVSRKVRLELSVQAIRRAEQPGSGEHEVAAA